MKTVSVIAPNLLVGGFVAVAGGRTLLMVNNSSLLKLAQMYEFTTDSPREKKQSVLTARA